MLPVCHPPYDILYLYLVSTYPVNTFSNVPPSTSPTIVVSSIEEGKSPLERESKDADKGQGLATRHPTSDGGAQPSADYFGVHWNDDQSTYPLTGGGQPTVIGHYAYSGE